nr:sperm-activating peptide [Glyptocidaris crenularis]prf//1508189A sperm-activating peptide b [Glyptocidaris crenularis]
SAKLCPGGNCV